MTVQLSQGAQADYYAILGVGRSATIEQIKAAFRLRVKQVHPDRDLSPGATDRFIALTEAYRVIGDVRIRSIYDQARFGVPASASAPLRAAPAARRRQAHAGRTRRASRRPGFGVKAACFAGALVACCCLVVDFGVDLRLMAAARADVRIANVSQEICSATTRRDHSPRRPVTVGAGVGARD